MTVRSRAFVRRRLPGVPAVLLLFAGIAAGLAACGDRPSLKWNAVTLEVSPKANDDSPVAVDLVMLSEPTLADEFLKLSANDWFQQKEQLQRDHPKGIVVHDWELVPGQVLKEKLSEDSYFWAGFVFARYETPGAHRARLAKPGEVTVKLGDDDVTVVQ